VSPQQCCTRSRAHPQLGARGIRTPLYASASRYRASELKHSRVAMLATVGWLVNTAGVTLPGDLSHGLPFNSLSKSPLEAWSQVPDQGKYQILFGIGLLECVVER